MRRTRRTSHYARSRKRKNNSVGLIVFLGVIGFFLWAMFTFMAALFSGVSSEAASADLEVLQGRADFLLTEGDTWSPAFSEQKFFAGESIRTGNNAHTALTFLQGHTVFLGANTELDIRTLEKKNETEHHIELALKSGEIWAKISEDLLSQNEKSSFDIITPRSTVQVKGTLLAIESQPEQDLIRLVKGSVSVEVKQEGQGAKVIKMGVGQKLAINAQTTPQIINGTEVLTIIDNEFIESEWHLSNLDRFFPQEAAGIRRKIELAQPLKTATQELEAKTNEPQEGRDDVPSPTVLSPEDQSSIPASQDSIVIEGTAPLEAFQIEVNGYTLTKFSPGDRKWTYFGATKFGTLTGGENQYAVVAITRDGKRSKPTTITVNYEGNTPQAIRDTPAVDVNQFQAPVVTNPQIFENGDPETVYQTSSSIVTFSGKVAPTTNRVEVNGFQLRKFAPGNTRFSYIANADLGNMKQGENAYTIIAFGPDGKNAQTRIRIFYSPLDL